MRVHEIPASINKTPASAQDIPLTAEIIDPIVQRVMDAVTQHLASGSSTDNEQSLVVSASTQLATSSATPGLAPPATLLEVPVGAPHSTTLQAQVAGLATTAPPAPGLSTSSSFAEAVLNTLLAIAQASIAGMPSTPECLFTLPSLPIDARVSEKIRRKIWNSEYFDFSLLLSNPVAEDRYQFTVKGVEGNSAAPAIRLEPVTKSKNVLTLDTWFNCFHIFVGIYCQKYPTEAPALMKYGEWFRIWQPEGTIGRFMMKTSAFRGSRNLRPSHGGSFIGNCGCALKHLSYAKCPSSPHRPRLISTPHH